jgi:ABC-2 type transport system ATP-binding protein
MADTEPALRCRGLVKRYGSVVAVDGLDLEVRRGECFGLLGPNGAGKTTAVEICEGLTEPDAGEVRVLGESWQGDGFALRARLGIQLQETKFPDKLRVREVVALFRSFYSRGRSVAETLALVELQEKSDAYVRGLSGGQKQRLSLGCALVGDPELLFLDEPTAGLDPDRSESFVRLIASLRERLELTVVMVTHDLDTLVSLADRVAVLYMGELVAIGALPEVIRVDHPFIHNFFGGDRGRRALSVLGPAALAAS